MSENPDDPSTRRGSMAVWGTDAGLFVLLPFLYVGSFGVCVWMYDRGWISEPMLEYVGPIYMPLWYAAETNPGLEAILIAFDEWCRS